MKCSRQNHRMSEWGRNRKATTAKNNALHQYERREMRKLISECIQLQRIWDLLHKNAFILSPNQTPTNFDHRYASRIIVVFPCYAMNNSSWFLGAIFRSTRMHNFHVVYLKQTLKIYTRMCRDRLCIQAIMRPYEKGLSVDLGYTIGNDNEWLWICMIL